MPTLSMASGDERSTWRFLGVDGTPAELTHSPRLRTDDLFTLRRAALQGIGAVLVPRLLVANDLQCARSSTCSQRLSACSRASQPVVYILTRRRRRARSDLPSFVQEAIDERINRAVLRRGENVGFRRVSTGIGERGRASKQRVRTADRQLSIR